MPKTYKRHKRKTRRIQGIPKGLQLLREGKQNYPHIAEVVIKCCATRPKCRFAKECERLYDIRCNKWYVDKEDKPKPTSHPKEQSIIVTIPVSASHERVLEAIERQLSVV